jgi:hypothetical protein
MKFTPEDLAVSISDVEDLLEALATAAEELEMGTYTNQIKGHRDKDL